MRKVFFTLPLAGMVLFLFSSKAFAITNTLNARAEGGSSASVHIENNVNSNSQSNTTSTTKTDVRIESNGVVKEYHSNGDNEVDIQSDDGKSHVTVNKKSGTTLQPNSMIPTVYISITPPAISTVDPAQIQKQIEEQQRRNENIFQKIQQTIENQFKAFLKILHLG